MDLHELISAGTLSSGFPLPHLEPFTTAMAHAAGLRPQHLTQLVHEGLLRRPIKGVYVACEAGDSLALRTACLRLVAPPDAVVVDRHAGWLLGAEMMLAPGEHLELRPVSIFRPAGNGRLRNGIARSGERWLRETDITEFEGLRVTTPLRTAWDLGRVRWTSDAISGLDAIFRIGSFTRDEFLAGIEQFRGHRWISTLRAIGPLADGRSESPGESVLRLRCLESGLAMTPQVEVYRDWTFLARLDLADEDLRAGVEYDGVEWHSSPDQIRHDRRRRAQVREEGWLVETFGKDDLFGQRARPEARLIALRQHARARRGLRVAG